MIMAKKNEYGFRNEVIKDFTPEQIHELILQKKIIDGMNADEAYKSLMDFFKKWHHYELCLKFNQTTFLKFVDELARTRQQMQDGFFGFSMDEKVGGSIANSLLKQGSTALTSVLIYFMVKYISDEKPENEFTRRVMGNLTRYKAWESNDEMESYATRNFHGKAMAIYHDEEFVLFLEDEFGIKDNSYDDSRKEFVASWAKMYLYLDEMAKSEPEKFKGLMPKNSIPTTQENHEDSDCSQEECEKVDIESLFKSVVSMQRELANANEEAEEAEEDYSQAEGEVNKLEKQIENLTKLLQEAKQSRDKAKAAMESAKEKVDTLLAGYTEAQQIFSKKYREQFGEMS